MLQPRSHALVGHSKIAELRAHSRHTAFLAYEGSKLCPLWHCDVVFGMVAELMNFTQKLTRIKLILSQISIWGSMPPDPPEGLWTPQIFS